MYIYIYRESLNSIRHKERKDIEEKRHVHVCNNSKHN